MAGLLGTLARHRPSSACHPVGSREVTPHMAMVTASHTESHHTRSHAPAGLSGSRIGARGRERERETMNEAEIFATEVYDEVAVTEVIRPAATVSG